MYAVLQMPRPSGVTVCHMGTRKRVNVTEIGKRVAKRRIDLGLQQEELADRAGVSRPYISRLERGVVPSPKLLELDAVAGALDMSIAELTSVEDPVATTEALRREAQAVLGADDGETLDLIVQKVRDRPPADRRTVLQVMDVLASGFPPISPTSD